MNRGMGVESCPECRDLMDRMRDALQRQMQALARLQDAAIHNDTTMRAALDAVVRESRRSREEAFQDFRDHLLAHRVEQPVTAGA